MDEADNRSYSAVPLALALLFTALGYACPLQLFPDGHPLNCSMSPEILNLYCLVGWMGLAHFIYAYYGQGKALAKRPSMIGRFVTALALGLALLSGMRYFLGFSVFSFLMWIYFIPHFVKAELHFGNVLENKKLSSGWAMYWFPALGFGFLTYALFCPLAWAQSAGAMFLIAGAVMAIGIAFGGVSALKAPISSRFILLGCFFIAEALVWATYRRYSNFHFQQGVYVFHIAIASFFHYFRSYDFAARMGIAGAKAAMMPLLGGVAAVNIAVIVVAMYVLRVPQLSALGFIFDVSFFTVWVGLHQFSSDVFSVLKRAPARASQIVPGAAG